MEGDSPLVDKAVFEELDKLIEIGLESISQERITPEMIEKAQEKAIAPHQWRNGTK